MLTYDPLVYVSLTALIVVAVISAYVIKATPETQSLETQKIRFAAATFTGIMMLIIFSATLYFVDPEGPGKEIFEKVFTGLSPIAGGIIGYFYAVKN